MTDLVKRDAANVAQYTGNDGIFGMEDLGREDIIIPRYKLVQNTSEQDCPGKLFSNLSGEAHDEIRVTLLRVNKFRVMWPGTYSRGDKPECRSFNGKTKHEGIGTGNCDTCSYGKWADGGSRCKMGYTFLGVDENNEPFMISARGASIKPVKKFLSRVLMKNKPLFEYEVTIHGKPEKNDKGKYFVLEIDFAKDDEGKEIVHTEAEIAEYAEILRGLNAVLPADQIIDQPEQVEDTSNNSVDTSFNQNVKKGEIPF